MRSVPKSTVWYTARAAHKPRYCTLWGDNCRVIKDNLFPVPPLFKTIKEQSDTDWSEMYKVFNMGHRLEVYLSPEHAEEVIAISKSFNIDAQIVGRVEESDKKELIIKSEFGEFKY